jgi:hypothetical protein
LSGALWFNPAEIVWKISPFLDLPPVKGGDWDIDRRHAFQSCAKYRAVKARFIDGADWLETDLFTEAYPRRLEREGRIGRARTIQEVVQIYERRIDPLFASMKRDGFRAESKSGRKFPLPAMLIGRDGEVFIGNQGNHRLAIAQVLGLDKFAGRIACRHKLWTP